MKRYILMLLALTLLTMPLAATASDQGWMPPEWSPTPPPRPTVDLVQLMQLLLAKGLISDQEYAQLIQPQGYAQAQPQHARVRASHDAYHNPVVSSR
jgi:hypothetical protein